MTKPICRPDDQSHQHICQVIDFELGSVIGTRSLATQMVETPSYTTKNSSVTFDAPQQSSGIQPGLR